MSKRAREGDAAPAGKAKRAKGTPASAARLSRAATARQVAREALFSLPIVNRIA